jgi:hypothetical protein
MKFRDAIRQTAPLHDHFKKGLQAIRERDRGRLSCSDPRRLAGSVNLEEALKPQDPNEPLWDYGVGFSLSRTDDLAFWIEVHPASSLHVDEVLGKLAWLQSWLRKDGKPLRPLRSRFCWLATGQVSFTRQSPQAKKLAQKGLEFPVKHLPLDRGSLVS